MANMLFANNCNTTLASSLTSGATSMSVTSATGFPSPTGVQYFYCTLADAATQTTIEIVKVTSVSGTTFAITRAQDGTSATAFAAGAVVSLHLVRASLNDFPKLDETNTFNADQAISGQLTSSAGLATTGTFTATAPSDGLIMDYATGFGRFSAFAGDGFQWYNAGIANTKLMQLSSSGVITTATWNGVTVGVAYGGTGLTSLTAGYIPYGNGTSAFSSSSSLYFSGTNLGIGTSSPSRILEVSNANGIGRITSSTGTNASFLEFNNISGVNIIGNEGSSGGNLFIGTTAYAFVLGTVGSYPLQLCTNNRVQATVFSSGGVSIGNTTDPGATNLSVNGVIKIGSNQAVNGPAFSAYATTNQSLSGLANTKVLFDTKEYDTNTNFSSSRFTPTVAGYYQLNAGVRPNNSNAEAAAFIYKNGSSYKSGQNVAISLGTQNEVAISTLVYANGSTDYFEVYVYLGSAGTSSGNSTSTWFNGCMVRGA